ncbi:hypothetical protein BUALT_Bualt11G0007900 [Buddleja alternifolia]|uniref:TSL-kinase interacting protein 1 n=1 Tax=Buddleja alternifolia TaxID=168488 RepID=A0AAV6WT76_9LAMI|nr:hypothetical protein BUALT_Bualt11G0007900 [Buddleja alternifolia]
MKSCKQQKRKIIEITRKQDDCVDVSVKKSTNGIGRGHQKATESTKKLQLAPQIQVQVPSAKIKLQLFPINEHTRLGLEKNGYNPFLELTLSARKKISSVLRHLDTKWGSSSVAMGQIMLFPYYTKSEQVDSCGRWTLSDSAVTAGEVYVSVGSPPFFRLRYGWYSKQEMFSTPPKSSPLETRMDSGDRRGCSSILEIPTHQGEKIYEASEVIQKQNSVNEALRSDVNEMKALDEPTDVVGEVATDVVPLHSTVQWDDNLTNLSIGGLLSEISLQGKFNGYNLNSSNKSSMQPIGLISDFSIGGLLSEASLLGTISNPNMKSENESSLQPVFLPSSDISIGGLFSEASLLSSKNKFDTRIIEGRHAQIQSSWDDNLTTLSIGGLLSEASLQGKAGCNPELKESKSRSQPNAPLSDSFDSFISAQLNSHANMLRPSCHEPTLSILDAEETCHAFPIRKLQSSGDATASNARAASDGWNSATSSEQCRFPKLAKMNNETVFPKDSSIEELKTNPLRSSLGAF